MPAINVEIILYRYVRRLRSTGLDVGPYLEPAGGQLLADMAEMAGEKLDAIAYIVGCIGFLQIAGIAFLHVAVTALDTFEVNGFAAAILLVLEDQRRAVPAKDIDQLQPILETFVRYRLVVFTSVIDEDIKRAVGQKELVRGMINLLPSKVPDVQAEDPSVAQLKFVPVNGNTPGRLAFRGQRLAGLVQASQQTGLARTTLAQDEHFGFIQVVHTAQLPLTEVVEDGVIALFHDLGRRIGKRAVFDVDAVTFP